MIRYLLALLASFPTFAHPVRDRQQLPARRCVEDLVQRFHIGVNSVRTQPEPAGDLFFTEPLEQQRENLPQPRGQSRQWHDGLSALSPRWPPDVFP